jgi:hypothetical protein
MAGLGLYGSGEAINEVFKVSAAISFGAHSKSVSDVENC